jgi:hypothetical protein
MMRWLLLGQNVRKHHPMASLGGSDVEMGYFADTTQSHIGYSAQPNVAPEISLLCKRVHCELVDVHLLV